MSEVPGQNPQMPETGGVSEPDTNNEQLVRRSANALQYALGESKNATIVTVNGIPTPGVVTELQNRLHLHHYTADELRQGTSTQIGDTENGQVITGYRMHTQDADAEYAVQGVIRAHAQADQFGRTTLTTLVLAEEMPNAAMLANSNLPWYNGPVDNNRVWSLDNDGEHLTLTRHMAETQTTRSEPTPERPKGRVTQQRVWKTENVYDVTPQGMIQQRPPQE